MAAGFFFVERGYYQRQGLMLPAIGRTVLAVGRYIDHPGVIQDAIIRQGGTVAANEAVVGMSEIVLLDAFRQYAGGRLILPGDIDF